MEEHFKIQDSEEKFREIYSSMFQALVIHEAIFDELGNPIDYRFVEVNAMYEEFFGLKRENVIGKRIKEISPNIEQYWIDNYCNVAKTGKPSYYENYSGVLGKRLSTYTYCPKPGYFSVLVIDKTNNNMSVKKSATTKFKIGSIEYDVMTHQINNGTKKVELNPIESIVFLLLLEANEEIVNYEKMMRFLNYHSIETAMEQVKVYIHRLRKKLKSVDCSDVLIVSYYSKGYSMSCIEN